jgi:ESS family glutamate:Na+ symporter
MVGLIYLITWGLMSGLASLFQLSNVAFLNNTVTPLLFGFNFIVASLVTILVKVIIKRLKKSNIMHRTYTNDFLLNRIGGFAFDFMIITSIMAIDIESISSIGMIVTLLVLGVVGGFITYYYDIFITRRVYKDYPDAAFLAFYGTMTGTTSTGIAILRELDPNFETPAASDLVVGSTTAIMFGFPLLLIVGVIFRSTEWLYGSLAIMTVMFFVFNFFLLKKPSLKKKK